MSTRIARSIEQAQGFGPSAVAMGVFDGVHRGHQELLRRTIAAARERGLKSAVLTFDPHPACVVAPGRAPKLLLSIEERCRRIAEAGIEEILVLPFTEQVAAMPPDEFAARELKSAMNARAILVGDNFRFGCERAGDIRTLAQLGFEVLPLVAVSYRGTIVSSSEIRRSIEAGDVSRAGRFLNRPYGIEGNIIHGHGIGSKQTVPTLNLATAAEVLPATGVYITRTTDLDDSRQWDSISNIGVRPTFEREGQLSIETYLLSPFAEPTPLRVRLEFLRRVREERKFSSPDALKTQILKDVSTAQKYFRRLK
jgi:riboflavin kinase/FMN adenylyltransferase